MSAYQQLYSHDPLGFGDISIHHIPNYAATSVITLLIINSVALGAVFADVCTHLDYDYRLLSSPGWRSPLQIVCRSAYFVCRYGTIVNLFMILTYINVPFLNCAVFFEFTKWIWWFAACTVDVIFFTRTAVLLGNPCWLVIPLTTLFATYFSLGVYCVAYWGSAVRIPNSPYCAFQCAPYDTQPLRSIFLAFYILTTTANTFALLSTIWALRQKVKGQSKANVIKLAFSRRRWQDDNSNADSHGLLCMFLFQAFVLYGLLEMSKMALVFTHYFTNNQTAHQLTAFGVYISVGAIISGYLLRQASLAMREMQKAEDIHTNKVSESAFRDTNDDRTSTSHQRRQLSSQAIIETTPCRLHVGLKKERSAATLRFDHFTAHYPAMMHDDDIRIPKSHSGSNICLTFSDTDIKYTVTPDNRVVFRD